MNPDLIQYRVLRWSFGGLTVYPDLIQYRVLRWSSGGLTVYPDLIQYRVCAVVSAVEFRWFGRVS